MECYECKKEGHVVNYCPKKRLRFDRDNFFKEILQEQMYFKETFQRNDRPRTFSYNKYERMQDAADYIQRLMYEVLAKSDKIKIQRRLAMKAFNNRKEIVRQNSMNSDIDLGATNLVNDLSDMDNSYLTNTTITLDRSQTNMSTINNSTLAMLEATDVEVEEVLRWVEPKPEQDEAEQEENKKPKKKDPYSLKKTPKKEFDEFDKVMEFRYYFTHNNLSEAKKKKETQ
jgi:hypothetical protein